MIINKVYDANIYINGGSTHGQASEVVCPNITAIMNDYNALGMIGTLQLFNGFEAMECTINWKYPDNEVKRAVADPTQAVDIMVRSSKATYDSEGINEELPVIVYMRGFPKQHPGGTFRPKEDTELQSSFHIFYIKEEVAGEEIVELDVMNNIFKVDGEDRTSERRKNLGI